MQDFNLLNVDLTQIKKDSINELLQDQDVLQIVNDQHFTTSDLDTYWVEFLDLKEDHQLCLGCKGLFDCKKVNVGFTRMLEKNEQGIKTSLMPCIYGKKRFEDIQVLNQIILKNVDESLLLDRKDEIRSLMRQNERVTHVWKELMDFVKQPSANGFYLHGNIGSGKSTLMGAFIQALAKDHHKCGIIHFQTFLTELKGSFNETGNNDALRLMREVEYLVIDDIGNENITAWSRDEILFSVLSYRFQNQKPTFFTSDYTLDDLARIYTDGKKHNIRGIRLINLIDSATKTIKI